MTGQESFISHLIELRSGREGHPAYRAVAQAMHERIAAVHPGVAAAMEHVDASREPAHDDESGGAELAAPLLLRRKRVGGEEDQGCAAVAGGIAEAPGQPETVGGGGGGKTQGEGPHPRAGW